MGSETRIAGQASVYDLFRSRVRARPADIALQHGDAKLTYAELLTRVNRLAGHLLACGVNPGDRIAILSRNRPEYLELQLAAAAIGAIVACLNWRLAEKEQAHCIALVDPVLAICEPELEAALRAASDLPAMILGPDFEAAIDAQEDNQPDLHIDPEHGLVILYTSGTTGLPKGAVVSHRAMIARAMVFASELKLDAEHTFLAWAPMFHMISTDHALATLMRGGRVIVIDGFQAEEICAAVADYRIGWLVLIPGMIDLFCEAFKKAGRPPKGVTVCGAMADLVPAHQIGEVTALVDAPYVNSFGATETGIPPATRDLIAPGVVPDSLAKRQNAFCDIKLVDPEDREVPDGEPGELAMRGPTLFSGYWNAEETNARDFRGGWFHMGDVFRRRDDGALEFVDRAKYLIKSGGENVYPAEIERVLLADPLVSEAVVVKAPDPKWGESPVAFVSRNDETVTQDSLMAACRAELAGYKRPREIHFIDFGDFPRSTSGKVQRHLLEERLDKA